MSYKNTSIRNIIFILFSIATVGTSAQNTNISTVDGKTLSIIALDTAIEEAMKEHRLPGLSIAIINRNEMVYHRVFGVSNVFTGKLLDEDSMFEGASLSKPIFAYFVMKMVENGTIGLDVPLHDYLPHPGISPESQEDYKLITARMVLAHQTGFPNHANGEAIRLAFTPGSGFIYSGEAYQYLAAVIGIKMGVGYKKELNDLFQEVVTQELNMPHTTFVWDDYLESHKVFGHDSEGKPTQNRPGEGRWSGNTFNAFSSVHSEAAEFSKFIIAVMKGDCLNKELYASFLAEQNHFDVANPLKIETGQSGWGLGFAQKPTRNGLMHLHTGNNHDFQSYAMFLPASEYGIVMFTNSGNLLPFIKEISKTLGEQF